MSFLIVIITGILWITFQDSVVQLEDAGPKKELINAKESFR